MEAIMEQRKQQQEEEQAEWQRLFGGIIIKDLVFNECNFPLEPVGQLKRIAAKKFLGTAIGWERMCWAEREGLKLALPHATGLYLWAHREVGSKELVVGGGQWRRAGHTYVLIFCGGVVRLRRLDHEFGPSIWLFSP